LDVWPRKEDLNMRSRLGVLTTGIAGVVIALGVAQAQTPIQSPAQPQQPKTIGQTKPVMTPSLIVFNSRGANLQGQKLTLTGIAPNSIVFADRPVRAAGHDLTAHVIEDWASGSDNFAKDPPNATVSVLGKDGVSIRDVVVVLKTPKLTGDQLVFDVDVLEGDLANADGPAAVFIDIIGRPLTPFSFAGAARRSAYRSAWYGAAYHPYYPPPYYPPPPPYGYRPPCGYYPYPRCY
jgi:hypothetical protein